MKEVGGKLFLGILLLVFLSSGVFAFTKCNIVPSNECLAAADNYTVLRISALTNAHAQLPSIGTYPYVVCCPLIVENVTSNTTCSGTNEIVGLAATTNAHLERPEGTIYTVTSCFEDFKCISTTVTNCTSDYPLGVLSISSTTNAHAGGFDDYPTKICCGGTKIRASSCTLKSATWSVTDAVEGQGVRLVVTGSGSECNGRSASFNVLEKDIGSYQSVVTNPVNVAFNGATATAIWYTEYQDDGVLGGDPEYVFNVSLTKNSKIFLLSENELSVSHDAEYCATITSCEDYTNKVECESDASLCKASSTSSLPDVDCNSDAIACGCIWNNDSSSCEFGWGEIEECGNPTDGCKYGCTLCNNDFGDYCNLGSSCPSGEEPISNNNGTCEWGEGCTSSDCIDADTDSCEPGLYCLSGKCGSVFSPLALEVIGNCKITQTIEKGCEEEPVGYKIISWSGVWIGEQTGTAYSNCIKGGKTTVPCAAQVQLPFFDYIELIITVAVLGLMYFIMLHKKKHHTKKSKK